MPLDRHAGVGHQLVGIEVGRLAAMEDRLGDIGCEEAEPQHPGEVGAAQAGLLGHLGYRATAAREDLLQLMGSGNQLQQAGTHCHVNRRHARESVSATFQTTAVAVFHALNASVRNRLNRDLLSK